MKFPDNEFERVNSPNTGANPPVNGAQKVFR
jgi:hypothetical protein